MLGDEELRGSDYFGQPMITLQSHPDFSMEAYSFIAEVGQMTTAQLETLKSHKEKAANG